MLVEFSITPIDKEGKSLSEYIAKTINIIKKSGLQYELHAMG
ncbi:MAG: thiamine-binding protein, partial [Nitrospinota bacterium]|nr:thiamine-binding protein [Nitrospinota bacterium]